MVFAQRVSPPPIRRISDSLKLILGRRNKCVPMRKPALLLIFCLNSVYRIGLANPSADVERRTKRCPDEVRARPSSTQHVPRGLCIQRRGLKIRHIRRQMNYESPNNANEAGKFASSSDKARAGSNKRRQQRHLSSNVKIYLSPWLNILTWYMYLVLTGGV